VSSRFFRKRFFYVDNGATADTVFGYQERFAEYRYFPSQVTGPFRSNYTGTLDAWHLATNFASAPTLDTSFIQDSPPLDRVLAVPSEPNVLLDCYIELKHARCMPVYAIPGLGKVMSAIGAFAAGAGEGLLTSAFNMVSAEQSVIIIVRWHLLHISGK